MNDFEIQTLIKGLKQYDILKIKSISKDEKEKYSSYPYSDLLVLMRYKEVIVSKEIFFKQNGQKVTNKFDHIEKEIGNQCVNIEKSMYCEIDKLNAAKISGLIICQTANHALFSKGETAKVDWDEYDKIYARVTEMLDEKHNAVKIYKDILNEIGYSWEE